MELLYASLGLIFAFAWAVIVSCVVLSLIVAYRQGQTDNQPESVTRKSAMYDRWLDG
jgi:tryptophan-rich sensory protein